MIFLGERESKPPDLVLKGGVDFPLKEEEKSDFFEYVTNPKNAGVVFSNGLYRIRSIFPEDPDLLRKEGSEFVCDGDVYLGPAIMVTTANLRVSKYDLDREARVTSTKVVVPAMKSLIVNFSSHWIFEDTKASLEILSELHRLPFGLSMLLKTLPLQGLVRSQINDLKANIWEDFKNGDLNS